MTLEDLDPIFHVEGEFDVLRNDKSAIILLIPVLHV